MKINISVDDELVTKIDDYADRHYMTRSGVFTQGVTSLIMADELTMAMKNLNVIMQRIADNDNKLDNDTQKKLNELSAFVKVMSGTNIS